MESEPPNSSQSGIEATDLASLLCRFEEATSSSDDLNIPLQKKRKGLLIRAKSAGNSPRPTPPSTPPPTFISLITNKKLSAAQNPLSISKPAGTSCVTQILVPTSMISTTVQSPGIKILKTASQIQQGNGGKHPQVLSTQIQHGTGKSLLHTAQIINVSSYLPQQLANRQSFTVKQPVCKYIPVSSLQNPNVPRTGNTTNVSSIAQQAVLTGQPACGTSGKSRLTFVPGPAISSVQTVTSAETAMTAKQNIQSQVLKDIDANVCRKSTAGSSKSDSMKTQLPTTDHQNLDLEDGLDHNYCSNEAMVELNHVTNAVDSSESEVQGKLGTLDDIPQAHDAKCDIPSVSEVHDDSEDGKKLSHEPVADQENASSAVVNEFVFEEGEILVDADGNDTCPQAIEEMQSIEESQLIEETQSIEESQSIEEAPGIQKDHSTEEYYSGRVVTFNSGETGVRRKRQHRYRQRAEFSTSPIREDNGDFFDKIPSFYTALAIPTKPMTTSVFASASKAIGSTDHLDLMDTGEPDNDGHFDKVPAHRRCFTNTTKEVEVDTGGSVPPDFSVEDSASGRMDHSSASHDESSDNLTSHHHSERRSRSTTRRSRSTSRYSGRSGSSVSHCSTCSYRSSSTCSTCSGSSRSRSRSPSYSRSPVSDDRLSRSVSPGTSRDRKMRGKRSRRRFTPERWNNSRSRTRSPAERSGWRARSHGHRRRRCSSSTDSKQSERRKAREEEKIRAMEERRVVYVGKIPNGYTKRQLYQRFECFGEIKEVKVNFREHGDNYGFVTFAYACDAIAAKEKGNNIEGASKFDLCFGGRRRFCPDEYADLDGNREIEEEYAPMSTKTMTDDVDYAELLKQHSFQQKKKKSSR